MSSIMSTSEAIAMYLRNKCDEIYQAQKSRFLNENEDERVQPVNSLNNIGLASD